MILPSCSICDRFAADTMPTVPANNRIVAPTIAFLIIAVAPLSNIFNNLLKVSLSSLQLNSIDAHNFEKHKAFHKDMTSSERLRVNTFVRYATYRSSSIYHPIYSGFLW